MFDNMIEAKLKGAILMIGSLFWETEEKALDKSQGRFREEWRQNHLRMTDSGTIKVPVRYGRRSSGRRHTYTMMFSHSVPKDGNAYLVPFQLDIDVAPRFSELYNQAILLAKAESICKENESILFTNWGAVALFITPALREKSPDIEQALRKYWSSLYRNAIKAAHYRIAPEPSVITDEGFLDIPLTLPDEFNDLDFILATPVVTKEVRYPNARQIADAMKQEKARYYGYFLENVSCGLSTYQDHVIMKLLPPEVSRTVDIGIVQLCNYKQVLGAVEQFQNDLQFQMKDRLLVKSKEELCFHAFQCLGVTPITSTDPQEIRQCASILLGDFEKQFGRWDNKIEHAAFNELDFFLYYFLNLSRLPVSQYDKILELVDKDLQSRDALIDYYESLQSIKKYIKNGGAGASLKDNMEIDFYNRNKADKEAILSYKLEGLKERVLFKCAGNYFVYEKNDKPFEWYFDRPYISSYPNAERYFDHRKIDKLGHRLLLLSVPVANNVESLYNDNRREFYKQLFANTSPDEIFRQIEYLLDYLPGAVKERKKIFEQLKVLFIQQLWYGFYSLSLTQLEGLYTDLLNFAKPDVKAYVLTLPRKVKEVRPEYEADFIFYDYCQYEIAAKRNGFFHHGLPDEVEMNSYNLLIDLWYLLQIFASHKSPIMEINRIIRRRDMNDFLDEEGFNHYFNLLEQLSIEHKNQLADSLVDFEKNYLSGYLDLEDLAYEMAELIPKTIDHWYNSIESFIRLNGAYIDIRNLNESNLTGRKSDLRKYCKVFLENHRDIFVKVNSYQKFLARYKKNLPTISVEADNAFLLLSGRYKNEFSKIEHVRTLLG
jgi:hypothetical protein